MGLMFPLPQPLNLPSHPAMKNPMNSPETLFPRPDSASEQLLTRRAALKSAAVIATAAALAPSSALAAPAAAPDARRASPKRYELKKSINLWAFPYPHRM